MPIPLYTTEKPCTTTSASPSTSTTTNTPATNTTESCDAAKDELARTLARRTGDEHVQAEELSREEALRLYEERMEEEYAKREGARDTFWDIPVDSETCGPVKRSPAITGE
ncbi:hypothetical protein FN846DRAFT_911767 [Sphaerosporella brunnea]|uniref:Uncharacterized protein n=1 Tax=Sphaerosporella brunnea TaxID=1250544 RepID=A0A5J5EL13_9PEZI|nr:hypothetical protein FN846DRAFT_911767 [Sphaerosporella brunnea]